MAALQKNYAQICFYAFVIFLILFLFVAFISNEESIPFDNEPIRSFDEGWYIQSEQGILREITLPVRLNVPKGQPVIITRTVPADIPGPTVLCFRSSQQSVRVVFEGDELYSFGKTSDSHLFGKSPGSAWNLVRLPEGCAGGRVSIELNSPYKTYTGYVSDIRIGTKASLIL